MVKISTNPYDNLMVPLPVYKWSSGDNGTETLYKHSGPHDYPECFTKANAIVAEIEEKYEIEFFPQGKNSNGENKKCALVA